MFVTHLSLTDFRNYTRAEVALEPGANLFIGRNGQGKTNLVEAIGYISTLGSHRVSSDHALIRQGCDAAIVRTKLEHQSRQVLVEIQLNRNSANRAQVNRSAIKPRELPRYFSSVLFAPEDLALVRGEPAVRRRFLDQLLVQRSPRLSGVLADYDRVVKQRNTLLKTAKSSRVREDQLGTLEVWNERLIMLGSEIIYERMRLITALAEPVSDAYRSVVEDEHNPRLTPILSIFGADSDDDANANSEVTSAGLEDIRASFSTSLTRLFSSELERGLTLVGPHRDDVLFEVNGLPAKGYASHGESWSFALSVKLASAELLRQSSTTGDPVIILDDVFAELDQNRRRMLAHAVAEYEQVLITAAVFEDVPVELRAHTVRIEAGVVLEQVDTSDASSGSTRE